jgi:hypothetical protein
MISYFQKRKFDAIKIAFLGLFFGKNRNKFPKKEILITEFEKKIPKRKLYDAIKC